MRPGVDWLHRRARLRRGFGVLIHYPVLLGVIALFLWLVVPRAIDQVQQAIGSTSIHQEATHSTGIKHDILSGIDKRLRRLPSGSALVHPAVSVTKTAFEVLVGIFFMFAVGAYWIFERDNTIALVQGLSPRKHRRIVRDTWVLIDQKLGAFVRGELVLIAFVAVLLSTGFWAIGLPYWLLIGPFAGVFEIVPVIGPIRGRRPRGRRRPHGELAPRALRRVDRARPAPDRGLRRRPEGARARGRALPARRARVGDGRRDPARRLLRAARDPDRRGARDARRRRVARHRPRRRGRAGGYVRGTKEEAS